VQLRSDTYGELWLVPAYTGKPRKEITPEHAATVMRVLDGVPRLARRRVREEPQP
jgi:hypothetical protein